MPCETRTRSPLDAASSRSDAADDPRRRQRPAPPSPEPGLRRARRRPARRRRHGRRPATRRARPRADPARRWSSRPAARAIGSAVARAFGSGLVRRPRRRRTPSTPRQPLSASARPSSVSSHRSGGTSGSSRTRAWRTSTSRRPQRVHTASGTSQIVGERRQRHERRLRLLVPGHRLRLEPPAVADVGAAVEARVGVQRPHASGQRRGSPSRHSSRTTGERLQTHTSQRASPSVRRDRPREGEDVLARRVRLEPAEARHGEKSTSQSAGSAL